MIALPPYAQAMGIVRVDAETDTAPEAAGALLCLPAADHLVGRPGFLHGGAIAGLLEIAAHVTLQRAIAHDPARIKPVNLTVDYMRGGRTVTTYAAATILRLGKRIANVETYAWQRGADTRIAAARLTMLLDRTPR